MPGLNRKMYESEVEPATAVATGLEPADESRQLVAILGNYMGLEEGKLNINKGVDLYKFNKDIQGFSQIDMRSVEAALNPESGSEVFEINELRSLFRSGVQLTLLINSNGGIVELLKIITDFMAVLKKNGSRITAYGTADVSSAAAMILAKVEADNRYVLPFTNVLFHLAYETDADNTRLPFIIRLINVAKLRLEKKPEDERMQKILEALNKELSRQLDYVFDFCGEIMDEQMKKAIRAELESGKDVAMSGIHIVKNRLASGFSDFGTMKNHFSESTGWLVPVDATDPIEVFWQKAEDDYKVSAESIRVDAKEAMPKVTTRNTNPRPSHRSLKEHGNAGLSTFIKAIAASTLIAVGGFAASKKMEAIAAENQENFAKAEEVIKNDDTQINGSISLHGYGACDSVAIDQTFGGQSTALRAEDVEHGTISRQFVNDVKALAGSELKYDFQVRINCGINDANLYLKDFLRIVSAV